MYTDFLNEKMDFLLQDTHNVRSVSFHPSGDFLLAGDYNHYNS